MKQIPLFLLVLVAAFSFLLAAFEIGIVGAIHRNHSPPKTKDKIDAVSLVYTNDPPRGCFTRSQVQPFVNALAQLYEFESAVPSEAKAIARDALDYAGRIGF